MMLAYQKSRLLFLLFCLPFFLACKKPATHSENGTTFGQKTDAPEIPGWLQEKITEFEIAKPTNPPVKIYRYFYGSQRVYFITGRCCDIPSEVYDEAGRQLCQPDGGITGRGDGKCPAFFTARTQEQLIWEDLRK